MIGEAASRSSLELPGRQLELLQAVVATGTPVVLLVMNGRPLDLRWAAEHVPAILDIWYPGTQGGTAVANLLFGDVSPGRQAALHLAADSRAGADVLLPHHLPRAGEPGQALLGRGEHTAVPVRLRAELRPVHATPTSPSTETARRRGQSADRVGHGHQHRRPARPTRSSSSICTSDTGRRRARFASSRASGASASTPGVAHREFTARAGRVALLERGRPGLGYRRLHLRRLGGWRLDRGR